MAHLSLTFLGAFQATLGDKPLTNFRSAKVQGLLVYLALTNQQPHAWEVLAALFWPDEPEAAAKLNLRQSLYRLRQVLGDTDSQQEPHLLVTRSTVQFNAASDHSLDATAFLTYLENDQLEQAVPLYRGELLPGFTCDSLPFEEWLRQERERLHRLALEALFELTARSLARADYHMQPETWPNANWPWNPGAKKRTGSSCRPWPWSVNAAQPWPSTPPVERCWQRNWARSRRRKPRRWWPIFATNSQSGTRDVNQAVLLSVAG